MKFKNPFSFRSRPKPSATSNLSDDGTNHLNSVYLASVVVSEYGAVLEENSIYTLGVSEKRLPYPKKKIEAAIELLLRFLHKKEHWGKLKQKYPQIAAEIMTDRYYKALRVGYMELAKFLSNDEAEPCERASRLLKKQHDIETIDGVIDELKLPWFEEVLQINKRITADSSLRLKRLQDNFGTKETLS
jgi:hypothetical protein